MHKAWTVFVTVALLLALSGCVLPPVVTLASYSVDIVTYEATGKTATDHVYSAIARSDCSFIRVLHDKPICVDPPAAIDAATADAAATIPTNDVAQPAPAAQSQTAKVTIGSFRNEANAERAVSRYADWHPVITKVTVGGQAFHRVTANALSDDEAAVLKARLAADQPSCLRVAQN
jgi:cell division septation protein DedD